MRTARMLETGSREVLRGIVSTVTKENESITGCFLAAGFHNVTARSHLAGVNRLFL
jgi:hypothetical protein